MHSYINFTLKYLCLLINPKALIQVIKSLICIFLFLVI